MATILSQIEKFKEMVSLCSSSFRLTTCADNIAEIAQQYHNVTSVYSIKLFIESARTSANKGTRDSVVYAQWFLDNFNYVRELKSNFKSRIYQPLLQRYNNHNINPSNENRKTLHMIVEKAAQLMKRLDRLMDVEGEIDPSLLTIDSENLNRKGIPTQQQSLIKLVPNALMLLDELAMLATDWQAAEAKERAEHGIQAVEVHHDKQILIRELSRLTNDIDSDEKELEMESEELHSLLEREERSNRIKGENHSLEVKMNDLQDKLSEVKLQMTDTKELIQTASNNSKFRAQLQHDLAAQKKQAAELELKMKVLRYQMDIVIEDLCVELEIKPSIIRLTNCVQDHCMKLENSLELKMREKERIVQALRPISHEK